MLTISADLSQLTQLQRSALSDFVLKFPSVHDVILADSPASKFPDDGEKGCDPVELEPTPEEAFGIEDVCNRLPEGFKDKTAKEAPVGSSVDKSGLPWDERIHSSSKALTADGNWRRKRGIDDALVAQVEAQLKQLMSIPAAPAPVATVPPPPVAISTAPPHPPEVDQAVSRQSYINFIGHISTCIQASKITQAEVVTICQKNGVESLPLLAHRLDLVPQVAMEVEALIVSR